MVLQAKNDQESESLCIIAYGSNLPSTLDLTKGPVEVALELLSRESLRIVKKSRQFRTPAFPPGAGPDFVNGAVLCATQMLPEHLLDRLHAIERAVGRTRDKRWEARVIDLDIVDFDGHILPDLQTQKSWRNIDLVSQMNTAPEQLVLPHPRVQDRAFVLVPMADISPDWIHPVTGKTLAQMTAAFSPEELSEIKVIDPR